MQIKQDLNSLLIGAIASDMMMVNLHLRERKEKPTTFLQLLKDIRAKEEYEAWRKKISPVVHSAYVKQNIDLKQTELQRLEIK